MALREAARGVGVGMSSSGSNALSLRRIQRELKEISESPSRHWTAAPSGDDLFEWQFALRGPPGTDFEGGIYTGRIVLPVNYPLDPPSITLLTPNGRWEVGKKICLSNTSFHAETWQPAWGIRTMMEALRAHMPVPGEGAVGAIDWPSDLRRRLAKESLDFVCGPAGKRNRELLPELSPEELKEELPEPLPKDLAPPAPGAGAQSVREEPAVPADGEAAPAVATPPAAQAEQAQEPATVVPQGLGSHQAVPSPVPVPSSSPVASAATAAPAAPRRRREGPAETGQRTQRRPQASIMTQLFKPPTHGRGWLLLLLNALITLVLVSFLATLGDVIRNPPKLLDPLPEPKESKDAS
ncbi:unnamed protein product [Polarella glacialis]|uniref:UBC core domain-containing protein n=1 Tax=Polarella glacialis TaxID=89957 RepID=A0A813JNF2_POLGL|nr:unnamed protein product [Polarella glacialis]